MVSIDGSTNRWGGWGVVWDECGGGWEGVRVVGWMGWAAWGGLA